MITTTLIWKRGKSANLSRPIPLSLIVKNHNRRLVLVPPCRAPTVAAAVARVARLEQLVISEATTTRDIIMIPTTIQSDHPDPVRRPVCVYPRVPYPMHLNLYSEPCHPSQDSPERTLNHRLHSLLAVRDFADFIQSRNSAPAQKFAMTASVVGRKIWNLQWFVQRRPGRSRLTCTKKYRARWHACSPWIRLEQVANGIVNNQLEANQRRSVLWARWKNTGAITIIRFSHLQFFMTLIHTWCTVVSNSISRRARTSDWDH